MEINVTENAARQLAAMGLSTPDFLRLGVKAGGCAGMSYDAYIDDAVEPNDQVIYENDALRIIAHERFLPLLDGLTIDFSDDLVRPGFILKNPNVQQSCGCGSSFKTDEAPAGCGGCGS